MVRFREGEKAGATIGRRAGSRFRSAKTLVAYALVPPGTEAFDRPILVSRNGLCGVLIFTCASLMHR